MKYGLACSFTVRITLGYNKQLQSYNKQLGNKRPALNGLLLTETRRQHVGRRLMLLWDARFPKRERGCTTTGSKKCFPGKGKAEVSEASATPGS